MAPRARTARTATDAYESEDDLAAVAAISSTENRRATLNGLKSTKYPKVMRRASTNKAATKRKTPATTTAKPRAALKDRTNLRDAHASDTEEVDDFETGDMDEEVKPKGKRTRAAAGGKKKVEEKETKPAAKKSRTAKRAPEPVIPETQQDLDAMEDVSQSVEGADELDALPALPAITGHAYASKQRETSMQPRPSARAGSTQPGYPAPRERSGSVSGTERERRGGDPELRRRLNDITRKHENLNLKYQNLQELGKNSAETNFEKLKRASDDKAKSADALIASLRKELAEARKVAKVDNSGEVAGLQKQVKCVEATNEKLAAENKELKARVKAAESEAKAQQNEGKALEAKLAATREQIATATAAQQTKAAVLPVSASEAQKEAKMKENLYSDLTGLIIRNIKRKDSGDEFDCLQTGRNGTLHFRLTLIAESNPKTPSGASYEDQEFTYEPLLDENRDAELVEILPDYLTEDIEFPRLQAPKFYNRVLDSMMKRVSVEEE